MCIVNPKPCGAKELIGYKKAIKRGNRLFGAFSKKLLKDGIAPKIKKMFFRLDNNLMGRWSAFKRKKDAEKAIEWWNGEHVVIKVRLSNDLIEGTWEDDNPIEVIAGRHQKILKVYE